MRRGSLAEMLTGAATEERAPDSEAEAKPEPLITEFSFILPRGWPRLATS